MIKVSVIMPSLNVVGYIRETMDSVAAQTLTDIEVICVDAGSTDGTLEILEDYASRDDRIRLIRSEKKSYGYQMNLGIAAANGEYIGIVETDDYIEPDMFEKLYEAAVAGNLDIVKSDFDVFTKGSDGIRLFVPYSLKKNNRVEYNRVYSAEDYLAGVVKPECYIWNGIYRRAFIFNNEIRFNETPGASFQDFSFRYQTLMQARRIAAVEKVLYHYRRDDANASTYNARTAEFNYRETVFTLNVLKERGVISEGISAALISEFAEFAFWPYIEMVKWNKPAESTLEAFQGYRELFRELLEKGYIKQSEMPYDLWMNVHFLLEGADFFMRYARVIAKMRADNDIEYLRMVSRAHQVVIFGTGIRGNAIYTFLKGNRIDNIVSFCDNNTEKQGTEMYGVDIVSPEEAVRDHPNALFILTSPSFETETRRQLKDLGVDNDRISLYPLGTGALFCTNCLVKDYVL